MLGICLFTFSGEELVKTMRILTRRILTTTLLCFLLYSCSSEEPTENIAPEISDVRVDAAGETLVGETLDAETTLSVFRGIPYAAPPVGHRRWRPPAKHKPRKGTQQATTFGPACTQLQSNPEWYRSVAVLFGNPPETIGPLDHISEDCLYLNIWSANLGSAEKQPVMVWIHGGANIDGYAHEPNYRGHSLAKRGIVFVSINYRLGVFGFMAHEGLSQESEQGISGNYGILDQIAALRWVKKNISAFGGDPQRVTIFGESAGGGDVGTLIASPLTKDLFQQGIIQSGGYPVDSFLTLAEAQGVGQKIAANLEISESSNAETVETLRKLDWGTLVNSVSNSNPGPFNEPNIDGYVLPQPAAGIFAASEQNQVPLLIGTNANESFMYLPETVGEAELSKQLDDFGEDYGKRLGLAVAVADADDATVRLAMDRLGSARDYLCPSKFIADAMTKSGNDVYFYHFTRVRPKGERILAYHGAEIPYVLDTTDDWLPANDIDEKLTEIMVQYWTNFAKNGSPDAPELPPWPLYTESEDHYLGLGDTIQPADGLETEICAILSELREERLKAIP